MATIVRWFYTLLLALISPVLLCGLYRSRPNKPKFGNRWKEHFGFTPKIVDRKSGVLWVHAVSVGEVVASKKLVEELKKQYPDKVILVTTTTSTGAEQVEKLGNGIIHRYMPIDFSWCVQVFLNTIQPDALLIIETEIWPNTLHCISKLNIPTTLVNGRLSEKSLRNYQRLNMLIRPALNCFCTILTVHDDDKQRFVALGVAQSKVAVTGSIKYDVTHDDTILEKGKDLRGTIGEDRPVLIAASTHKGEDEQVLEAYKMARREIPNLLLILVPRHPERFEQVAGLVLEQGLALVRRTIHNEGDLSTADVLLGDTMGELMIMYAASDLVFMGGSLIGNKVGGHNFIEPALLSKPCITGPSYYNFSDVASQLIEVNSLVVTQNSTELAQSITRFFFQAERVSINGSAGYGIVQQNQGALLRTLSIIKSSII
ncbi:lipid IV(A) 3-deoxy-D-manno-octulosonic acid transferase [Vibrio kyushuensis]|uniref:lipid IV(A) 3-deoxy-D-manno-octulosonic acid transferase n=1 Tax=Vibrio kyushuensis TaxID=2910249 RepID=UPI003D140006